MQRRDFLKKMGIGLAAAAALPLLAKSEIFNPPKDWKFFVSDHHQTEYDYPRTYVVSGFTPTISYKVGDKVTFEGLHEKGVFTVTRITSDPHKNRQWMHGADVIHGKIIKDRIGL